VPRFFLVIFLLLSGCQSVETFTRAEYGYGSQWLIAKGFNDQQTGTWDGRLRAAVPMDGHYVSLAVGGRIEIFDNVDLGLSLGPSLFSPTKGPEGDFIGGEFKPRLSYTGWAVHPYIEGFGSIGRTQHRWEGEGTKFQFSVGGGLGFAVPLNDAWEVDLGYRFYHISNGSAIFGTTKPNVGYNTDMVYFGLQRNF